RFRKIGDLLRRTPFRPAAAHPRRSAQPAAKPRIAVPRRATADRGRQARLLRRFRVQRTVRSGMNDETAHLAKTLVWTCGMILQSGSEDRQRIASAYQEAQETVAGIEKDNGDARPRIIACFKR